METEEMRDSSSQRKKTQSRGSRRKGRQQPIEEGESKRPVMAEDGHSSDYSTPSTSEEIEHEDLTSEDGLTDDEETGLTKKDRLKRKRRKRLNTHLDERVAASDKTTNSGWSLADKTYNRWMFSNKNLNFHFPLFTTCMHMAVQFLLASLVLYIAPRFRPLADNAMHGGNQSNAQRDSSQIRKLPMTKTFYLTRIGPCGTATGLDIGLGNTSLRFVTLTFFSQYTPSLAFVLIFAFLFRLEQPSLKLILIIATMTVGVIMMVAGETEFSALGFFLIISASFFSGFRWALTQILLLRNPSTSNPFSSLFFLAPIMFVVLAIIAIPVEGFGPLGDGLRVLVAEKGGVFGICILLFPGALAFCMTASEFALLQRTSVVTLSICGIFKEVITITTANLVFHDPLTPINVSGLIVTISSIASYNYIKITKMRKQAREDVELMPDGAVGAREAMLGSDDGDTEIRAQVPRSEMNGVMDQALVKKTDERS
ncbi:MAG: hypothetical protein Q9167_000326 [Letrouitia subvulpina]